MRRFTGAVVAVMVCVVLGGSGAVSGGEEGKTAEVGTSPTASLSGVDLSSQDPVVHLSYASILFYKGRRLLQSGDTAAGEAIFHEIEEELHKALKLAEPDQDASRRKLLKSQCAFMLGDIRYFVFHDPNTAMEFYREALAYFPEHDGASEALKRLTPEPPAQSK